jgi:hypothetical protein
MEEMRLEFRLCDLADAVLKTWWCASSKTLINCHAFHAFDRVEGVTGTALCTHRTLASLAIVEINRIYLVLSDMNNMIFEPYLAAIDRILI